MFQIANKKKQWSVGAGVQAGLHLCFQVNPKSGCNLPILVYNYTDPSMKALPFYIAYSTNISPVINVKTCLPVIVQLFSRSIQFNRTQFSRQLNGCNKIIYNSAATKLDFKLHLFLQSKFRMCFFKLNMIELFVFLCITER